MGESTAAVQVRALAKRYGKVEALRGVDLDIAPGEAFGLVGANGAGKSTLIRCLLDLCACDSGDIEIFGIPSHVPHARRRLAYIPERFNPPYYLRGGEFLALVARLCGSQADEEKAGAALDALAPTGTCSAARCANSRRA